MAKPLYVQEHEREQAYLNPPYMGANERQKWETYPDEYQFIEDSLQAVFERIPPGDWPQHLDHDPISLAQKFAQAAWWGRATGDPGYYKAVHQRYGHLFDLAK